MIGYILMGLGAYLIADDYIEKRRAKNATLLENGNGGSSGDNDRKSRADGKKSDRNGRVTAIGIPVESATNTADKKQGGKNELHKKSISSNKLDPPGGGAGDNSSSQSDTTSSGSKTKGVKPALDVSNPGPGDKPNEGGDNENNLENGTNNDGDNVDLELSGSNESDSSKTD